ncbi:MAG: tRNA 2-thiouridine(34) synthase MnmA [Thermodesulfobacteriota bacterium]
MSKKKVGIAMSGGVDSTATAILLAKDYEVHGFFMELAQPDLTRQKKEVQAIADRLNIPLNFIDLEKEFTARVLDYFSATYHHGRTPNPCMVCNREIKFGLFMDAIFSRDMDYMATGHYARIDHSRPVARLLRGKDDRKDQSYFLARLDHSRLARLLFPLGEMTKEEVYLFVEECGFDHFRGRESQDVCFLTDTQVGDYLERLPDGRRMTAGDIVDMAGNRLGNHKGLPRYTIGQRKGLGISDTSPWYVVDLDVDLNRVIVGKPQDLERKSLVIRNCFHMTEEGLKADYPYQVKIRYRHQSQKATVEPIEDRGYRIYFEVPQRAVTPGQFAVIYDDDQVMASGEIVREP